MNTLFKKTLIAMSIVFLPIFHVYAAGTTLSAGDIVIIGVNADDPDEFSFIPLVNLEPGTEITFTDSGWLDTNTFRGGEGAVKYTASSAISAGTLVTFVGIGGNFTSADDSNVGNYGFSLSANGDQILAFQGSSSSPTFIFAVQTNSTQWQTNSTATSNSALPLGLTDRTNAVAVGNDSGEGDEYDNAWYAGITSGTAAEILAAVANNANWTGNNNRILHFTNNFSVRTALTSGNILAMQEGYIVDEYQLDGTKVQSFSFLPPDADNLEELRDIIVGQNGNVYAFNGTFNPVLSILTPATNSFATDLTLSEWSTINNVTYGGIAAFNDWVFVSDMNTSGAGARGIVRFDLNGGIHQRFSDTEGYIQLTIGRDALLYGLSSSKEILVFNPITLDLLNTIDLSGDLSTASIRAIAVDSDSNIYGVAWNGKIYAFNTNGEVLNSIASGANSLSDINIDENGNLLVIEAWDGEIYWTNTNLDTLTLLSFTAEGTNAVFTTGMSFATLTMTKPTNGTVTSTVDLNCGTDGTKCSDPYLSGATVTLTATPDANYTFDGWGGDCSSASFTINTNMNCTATFSSDDLSNSGTPLTPSNVLAVQENYIVDEYQLDGTKVQSFTFTGDGGTESLRDIIVGNNGNVYAFNGTFNPVMSTLIPSTGNFAIDLSFSEWSTANNGTYGGIAAFNDWVFVSDSRTFNGGEAKGIVRFDLSNNSHQRFSDTEGYIQLTIGRDALLYGLSDLSEILVFNPITLDLLNTIDLSGDLFVAGIRAIAVDSDSNIYGVSWNNGKIYAFDTNGSVLNSVNPNAGSLADINIDENNNLLVIEGWDGEVYWTNTNLDMPTLLPFTASESNAAFTTGMTFASLTMTKPTNGTITSTVDLNCGMGGTKCLDPYLNGATVTLTATPDTNYTFNGWGGDCSSASFTINTDMNCTATFSLKKPEIAIKDNTDELSTSATIDLGSTHINGSLSKTLTIENNGSADLVLDSISLTGNFSSSVNSDITIAANASADITIELSDTSITGDYSGTLSFNSNDDDESSFSLSLTGSVTITRTEEPVESDNNDAEQPTGSTHIHQDRYLLGIAGHLAHIKSNPSGINCEYGEGSCTAMFDRGTTVQLELVKIKTADGFSQNDYNISWEGTDNGCAKQSVKMNKGIRCHVKIYGKQGMDYSSSNSNTGDLTTDSATIESAPDQLQFLNFSGHSTLRGGAEDVILGFILKGNGTADVVLHADILDEGVMPQLDLNEIIIDEQGIRGDLLKRHQHSENFILEHTVGEGIYTMQMSSISVKGRGMAGISLKNNQLNLTNLSVRGHLKDFLVLNFIISGEGTQKIQVNTQILSGNVVTELHLLNISTQQGLVNENIAEGKTIEVSAGAYAILLKVIRGEGIGMIEADLMQ
ncbi:choice-of-anchor D domain-containing protein [Candidatus Albibeggiatoa sp. nov. NOAA]|uniref:InlB B-repeat-containing protein n=1 Tax=Candidatus Albibeggiatoa sp. nov. NOAA TaxID=3162724 RepID=UPI0032F19F4F|nr:choice-of-anchor D domain-containing protein [Thiotrichaceae bacterium]